MGKRLTYEEQCALIHDYEIEGWTKHELTIIYRVSIRTVYRVLAKYQVPRVDGRRRRRVRPVKAPRRALKPCGTNAAYQRHRRAGEYPCSPCLEAHALDVQNAKRKKSRND